MPTAAEVISTYRPQKLTTKRWNLIRDFVVSIAADVLPDNAAPQRVRKTLFLTASLTDYCVRVLGYSMDVETVFHEDSIEFFTGACLAHLTGHSRATARSELRRIGKKVNPDWSGRHDDRPYSSAERGEPYTANEQTNLKYWAAE